MILTKEELAHLDTEHGDYTVTDDFYYILNAVNGEERKK